MSARRNIIGRRNPENIRSASESELASAYNMDPRTFKKWLDPFRHKIGEYRCRRYSPRQVKIIFQCLGEPDNYL